MDYGLPEIKNYLKKQKVVNMKKEIIAVWMCTILLLVVFSSGCIDFGGEEKEKNKEPIADAGPDQTVYVWGVVYLNGTGSDPDGTIVLYEWDFDGDGTYDWSSPTSGYATHTYNDTGTYVAILRVTDNDGATDSCQVDIIVLNVGPIANFTYSPSNPTNLDVVAFTDTSTDIDGTIVSWYWEFGDGNTSTEQNSEHQYNAVGSYYVNLTVTDNDDATDKNTVIITASGPYTNLLKNSGFEEGTGDAPLYWYKAMVPAIGLELSWDSEEKHSGNHSVSISNTHTYYMTVSNNWAQNIENISIGEDLELEGWIKMIDAENVNICIQCWSEDSEMLAIESTQTLSGTKDWKKYDASITVPSGTTTITVRAALTGTGQVWFDDITLAYLGS